ncbi:Hint domain-containing protein [Tranquillimonas rosea]|uniref:Hint domain-containing protein n=1 Tax=Tranquillimonas rosea TaxID=641238 RepID=UPI003BAB386D
MSDASQGSTDHAAARQRPWTVRRKTGQPMRSRPEPEPTGPTRRFDVTCLDASGAPMSFAKMGPAVPDFENAFSALARGTLIQTTDGPVAIEDLEPGVQLETDRGAAELVWIGAITLLPRGPLKLYRVPADSFGLGRPMPDLMLGPSARLVRRSAALRQSVGGDQALLPVAPLADGMNLVEITPLSPVRVFHLACRRHRLLTANGVEVESFHPGALSTHHLGPGMSELFLSFFPYLTRLSEFGPLAMPQVEASDEDAINAA